MRFFMTSNRCEAPTSPTPSKWCRSVASLNRVFRDSWTLLGIGTVNHVMNIPPWLKAIGEELGSPDAREKTRQYPGVQAAMSSFSRRSRTGTCAAAVPKVFAPRPMTTPNPVVLVLSATPTSRPPFTGFA